LLIFVRFYGIISLDLRRIVAPFLLPAISPTKFCNFAGPDVRAFFYLTQGDFMKTPNFLRNLLQSNNYWEDLAQRR
jgi:hypothetical protein